MTRRKHKRKEDVDLRFLDDCFLQSDDKTSTHRNRFYSDSTFTVVLFLEGQTLWFLQAFYCFLLTVSFDFAVLCIMPCESLAIALSVLCMFVEQGGNLYGKDMLVYMFKGRLISQPMQYNLLP